MFSMLLCAYVVKKNAESPLCYAIKIFEKIFNSYKNEFMTTHETESGKIAKRYTQLQEIADMSVDSSGNIAQKEAENKVQKEANSLLLKYTQMAGGIVFVPIPFANVLGVINLQTKLLLELCELYSAHYSLLASRIHVVALISGVGDINMNRLPFRKLLKKIPGIKILAGTLSLSCFAKAATYAVGKVFQLHFENAGSLINFRAKDYKEEYERFFKEEINR